MPRGAQTRVRQVYPVDGPQAHIDTRNPGASVNDASEGQGDPEGATSETPPLPDGLVFLHRIAAAGGDISSLLAPGVVDTIGLDAVREWEIDKASRSTWIATAERGLALAVQETDDDEDFRRDGVWEGSADIHYPLLTTAVTQFNARATPELIKGDKVVGVKTFDPPALQPTTKDEQQDTPPPQNPQQAQAMQAQAMQQQEAAAHADMLAKAKAARAQRVAHFMNWTIFYKMDNWEGETDLLLMECPVTGVGFKKPYMGPDGLASDYVSALRLTVHNDTKSLSRCPRITQDFDIYPYEIAQRRMMGQYRDIDIVTEAEDPEEPRVFIEQHRLEDLDHDGVAEPYIVTVDVETKQTLRIEAAYTMDDVVLNKEKTNAVRIERWVPFALFLFLPDPRGRFYGLGLARLLDAITASVDTGINQLIDAGSAEIAGGGFIGANVRLQGSGQSGTVYKQPGEWQTVSTGGSDLRQALFEFTVPSPSPVTMQMLEMLLAAAKDISSVKDVISGDAPSTAPVGTTLALQNQALQVFSAIYKRLYRGFRDEFRLMYHCLKRWATDEIRHQYTELTGGDFDQDFSGDGTDIQPIADPSVVTKMQKISRMQATIQFAESPLGMAAGMTQAGPAQALATMFLEALEYDRPEQFMATVPPNPELVAKVQELAASAALKNAQAQHTGALSVQDEAQSNLTRAETVEVMGNIGVQTHKLHQEAHRVGTEGMNVPGEPQEAPSEASEGKTNGPSTPGPTPSPLAAA